MSNERTTAGQESGEPWSVTADDASALFRALAVAYGMMKTLRWSDSDDPADRELHARGLAKVEDILGPDRLARVNHLNAQAGLPDDA